MTRIEWEHGVIKIPEADYAAIRDTIREAYNLQYDVTMKNVQKFWDVHRRKAPSSMLWEAQRWSADMEQPVKGLAPIKVNVSAAIDFLSIWTQTIGMVQVGLSRSAKPTKAFLADRNYQPAGQRETYFKCGMSIPGEIQFSNAKKTVLWMVQEGDRACELARMSHLGSVLFTSLHVIQWSSKSGGIVIGNDEHNDKRRTMRNNYIKAAFGPAGKREAESSYFSFR